MEEIIQEFDRDWVEILIRKRLEKDFRRKDLRNYRGGFAILNRKRLEEIIQEFDRDWVEILIRKRLEKDFRLVIYE